jgi:hypothetical protein
MRRLRVPIAITALITATVALGTFAYATWDGSVTDVVGALGTSVETQGCHDQPYYFNPVYGWTRSCQGAHDISDIPLDVNEYIHGYVWSTAQLAAVNSDPIYPDQTCGTPIGYEYHNAWEISVPPGTIGFGYTHMGNYHYVVNSTVSNGTEIGEMANWATYPVYYCNGYTDSTGPHCHCEAAEVGTNFSDYWSFNGTAPNNPFVHYTQP